LAAYTREQLEQWSLLILDYLHREGESPASSIWLGLAGAISTTILEQLLKELVTDGRVRVRTAELTHRNEYMRHVGRFRARVYSRVEVKADGQGRAKKIPRG
jgi:hypothetical protein